MKRSLALPFLLAVLGSAPAAEAVILPPVNAQIGFAVSADGGWLAVGAPRDDEAGEDAGAVFLYEWDGFCWRLQDKVAAGNAQAGALFGSSLSLRGDFLAVGAPGADAVYVFLQNDGVWEQQVRLSGTGGSGLRRFGHSVAITSDWLAVGEVDPHGRAAGVVRVFQPPRWSEAAVLALAEPRERARFGHALSLRGGTLAVGVPGSGQGAGAVHVFREQESRWLQQAVLTAGDGGAGDQLGHSVAISAEQDLVVAGAPTAGTENDGAAYVFELENGAWEQVAKLLGQGAGEQSGLAVDVDVDRILAGAPFSSAGAPLSGAVRVFAREDGSWVQQEVLSDPVNGRPYDLHGFSVTAGGERTAAGAPLADRGANASGSTYSFNCIDVPTVASGKRARGLSVARGKGR